MELITFNDFFKYKNKFVYAVEYSDVLEEGLLPFADKISTDINFNPTDIFNNKIEPSKVKITTNINKDVLNLYTYTFFINPKNGNWDNVHPTLKYACKDYNTIFAAIVEGNNVRTVSNVGWSRNIHIYTTQEECQEYIDTCNKIILHRLIHFYNTKINQYTYTLNTINNFLKNENN